MVHWNGFEMINHANYCWNYGFALLECIWVNYVLLKWFWPDWMRWAWATSHLLKRVWVHCSLSKWVQGGLWMVWVVEMEGFCGLFTSDWINCVLAKWVWVNDLCLCQLGVNVNVFALLFWVIGLSNQVQIWVIELTLIICECSRWVWATARLSKWVFELGLTLG